MKIQIESRGKGASPEDLAEKLEKIFSLLSSEDPRAVHLTSVLQEHTPLSYLVSPPAERVAGWVLTFLEFLDARREEVSVRFLAMEGEGEALLLTNCPDAPFILDSVQNFLTLRQLRHQVISHPILSIRRRQGKISQIAGVEGDGPKESFLIIELQGIVEGSEDALARGIEQVLLSALKVHRDRPALRQRLKTMEETAGLDLYREFWQWLQKGNFLPFSYRSLRVRDGGEAVTVEEVEGSALGLAPDPPDLTCCRETPLADLDPGFQSRILRQRPVVVENVARRSPIHQDAPLVYLGFREKVGDEEREHAFLGLFSQQSIDELAFNVPPLRRRLEQALERLSIPRNCHDYRKTVEIFNTFPKVELFFMELDDLVEIVRSFTLLYRHGAVKVVAARSLAVHGLTLLVIMPREFYAAERVGRLETYLRRFFRTSSVSTRIIHISADYLSLHVNLHPSGEEVRLDLDRLEAGLTNVIRPWELKLRLLLARVCGEKEGTRLWGRYAGRFSREYRTLIHPRYALRDIRGMEDVLMGRGEGLDLWGPFRGREKFYRLQFYSLRESYLNDLMPLLENLNLCVIDEVDFTLPVEDGPVFIKSFAIRGSVGARNLHAQKSMLLEALGAMRRGEAENDYLNRLLILTGLSWKDIDIFRGYRNYFFQLGSPFSKRSVAFALIHQPRIALLLYRYFEARFRPGIAEGDPRRREEEALSPLRMELAEALEKVTDINEDRILRILFNLIDSTVRTNFFLRRERPDYFFSFKISAIGIIDMPAPRPLFEVYVHSAHMEGIHLRGGKVARGGIRWSDRPDDFRTEILGLMKTQMTKNALIVPVGSKGGFVVKTPWDSREQGAELSKEAYKTLMRGLLDLTDNRVGGEIRTPDGVVAYDEPDPYLVVAADKGTAHLSDTANSISEEYGFWLGDAFASGGSHGYDHKKLGITARGAWECVKRHFRELGKDIQAEPFTVVGVGDMNGDVFGNGMLLSRQIRLIAAFDHRHIFLDPDPDPAVSFEERQRLYDLARSSWDDYRRDLISEGGGIWPRASKNIPLSTPVRKWLNVRQETMDGPGLIRLLLNAEAELFWNGGIGTYVKATSEKNEDAGDRSNDAVRVDASSLRCRVVGEGGNLGFTQKGRIEFALAGGKINTDAVDNSAGVDTSDHEVNLKILMQHLGDLGEVSDLRDRDRILGEVTDDVCQAVLGDNYGQSLCISLDLRRCGRDVEPYLDLAERLSDAGILDRRGEFLPFAPEVLGRAQRLLTRPELAILMAYSKMQLYQALVESDLPVSEGARGSLEEYFPPEIRNRFGAYLPNHPLAREIAATVITNRVIDQAGSAFLNQMTRRTGAGLVRTVTVYLAFDRVMEGGSIRRQINALDNRLPADRQYRYLLELEDALAGICQWALENELPVRLESGDIERWRSKSALYLKSLGSLLPESEWSDCLDRAAEMEAEGFSPEAAHRLSVLPYLKDFLPVTTLAESVGGEIYPVARTFGEVRKLTGIGEMIGELAQVPVRDRWDRLTLHALEKRLVTAGYNLTRAVWQESEGNPEVFFGRRRTYVRRLKMLQDQLRQTTPGNFHPFTVITAALEDLLG